MSVRHLDGRMTDYDDVDFFSDPGLTADPYPFYEHLRRQCPVTPIPRNGVLAVTGYEETVEVYRDNATYSSVNSALGPFPLPFDVTGDDVTAEVDEHRTEFPMSEHLVSFDPPRHGAHRALLNGLFTPKRLKENEHFMWRLADQLIDSFAAEGRCEFGATYGQPFPFLVIADLLGVPDADLPMFRELLTGNTSDDVAWKSDDGEVNMNPLAYLDKWFTMYITERREHPRNDVLTEMATQRFPDGSLPEVADLVHLATFLFIAGHETTARMLSSALQALAEDRDLQDRLRGDRTLIPTFIEEVLRLESPIKSDFRLALKATTLGGAEVPAGTTVMLLPGAANRDPSRFDCPEQLRLDRTNSRHNVAFARGIHSCPGGPLARIEGRVTIERILDRFSDIRIDAQRHGPPGDRRFDYVPLYILRGLQELHLEFTEAS